MRFHQSLILEILIQRTSLAGASYDDEYSIRSVDGYSKYSAYVHLIDLGLYQRKFGKLGIPPYNARRFL